LLSRLDQGYDMVVGTRSSAMHAGVFRLLANGIYNVLASWMAGVPIPDLTSGFRAVKADRFRQFLSFVHESGRNGRSKRLIIHSNL